MYGKVVYSNIIQILKYHNVLDLFMMLF